MFHVKSNAMNTCPWCGNQTDHLYVEVKDYFLSQEEFQLYQCDQCGLLFTVPRPGPDVIGKYYQSDEYYSHQENKKGLIPRIYEAVKSVNLKHKVSLAIDGLPKGRLLDIGCGVGDFLVHVQQKGWEVAGIEPSDDAKSITQNRLGFLPLDPSESTSFADRSFDVITMWHVLEHIDDLKTQLSELKRLLKPGGRLIIALPNYKSFDCQHYKDKWAAWDVPRHLNHFSPDVICSIISSIGMDFVDNQKLKWDAYYISFMSERYLHHSLPLLRGALLGLISNCKALRSGMYSSLVYRFNNLIDE